MAAVTNSGSAAPAVANTNVPAAPAAVTNSGPAAPAVENASVPVAPAILHEATASGVRQLKVQSSGPVFDVPVSWLQLLMTRMVSNEEKTDRILKLIEKRDEKQTSTS